ncbi:MAG TPA: alpha/beta hydrolase, partial [Nevskiaceae bacterium]|nr:alpha/beta hydrolase [Nevskiaceae bacterium]
MQPETRYVRTPRGDIAYQVVGEGKRDLVYLSGMVTHLDLTWDFPEAERYLTRLASFSRLILFDRRGTGISEAIAQDEQLSWSGWLDDLRAVLDATGSKSAALLAERDAGSVAMQFAASEPERVSALILANTSARYLAAPDYPCGESPQVAEQLVRTVHELWGSERMTALAMPSRADDTNFLRVSARFQRASATPSTAARQYRFFFSRDAREVLPQISCPTLVMHRREYPFL